MAIIIRHHCKIVLLCWLIFSPGNGFHAFEGFFDECPNKEKMIELQDIIENRYSMTCKNRCGGTVQVGDIHSEEKNLKSYATTSCSCDSLCYAYNDCCHNFEQNCPAEVEKYTREFKTLPKGIVKASLDGIITCRKGCISGSMKSANNCLSRSYKVISECVVTGEPCESLDKHDPNRFIPVYDQISRLHYSHLLCARCNGASNLRPWNYNIECKNQEAKSNLAIDNIRNSLEKNNCTIEVEPDDDMTGIRECFHDMEWSCPDSCQNEELVNKCERGPACFASAYVNASHVSNNNINPDEFPIVANFKNYYCGLCNGVPPRAIKCGNLYSVEAMPAIVLYENRVSLTTLFEFNVDVGFSFAHCPEGHLTVQHLCIRIPSEANITFVYTFKSAHNAVQYRNSASLARSDYTDTFDEIKKVFDSNSVILDRTTVNLKDSEDVPGDSLLTVTFNVTLNVYSSSNFLKCLEDVELVLRSKAADNLLYNQRHNQFIVDVQFENNMYSLDLQVHGIPTLCELTNHTNNQIMTRNRDDLVPHVETFNGVEMKCYYTKLKTSSQWNHLDIITYVCVCLSIICLLIRVGLQCYVPHFRSGPGRMQFNLTLALLMAFLVWLVGSHLSEYHTTCQVFAVVRYFAFMAAFAWMTNIAVDTWRLFRPNAQLISPDETTTPLSMYHLSGWLGTLILSVLVSVLDFLDISSGFKPNFGPPYCWIVGKALIYYFFIPTGLLLLTNIILFICTTLALRASFEESNVVVRKDKRNFQVYLKLFLLMGITWALGFVVAFTDTEILEYIYIFVNSLQGVFIFVAFVCTKRTFSYFRKYRFYSMSSSKRSNTGSTPLSSSKSH